MFFKKLILNSKENFSISIQNVVYYSEGVDSYETFKRIKF